MSGPRAARVIGPGALMLTLIACGGGARVAAPPAPAGTVDLVEYCAAVVAVETVEQPSINADTQEGRLEQLKAFTTGTLRPLVDQLLAVAPPELTRAYAVQNAALAKVETTGDFATAFQTAEVQAAVDAAHEYDVANCTWDGADVVGIDYAFEGVPATFTAGPVTLDFSNASENGKTHQMTILRKSEEASSEASFEELLQLPQKELSQQVTYVAGTFAEPGSDDYIVLSMAPGEYAMVCLIPLDETDENPQPTDPSHMTEGMIAEFTVE
ncbi:MAG: hypothetical protein ACRD0K_09755 [Egibacteraceae bacterium]